MPLPLLAFRVASPAPGSLGRSPAWSLRLPLPLLVPVKVTHGQTSATFPAMAHEFGGAGWVQRVMGASSPSRRRLQTPHSPGGPKGHPGPRSRRPPLGGAGNRRTGWAVVEAPHTGGPGLGPHHQLCLTGGETEAQRIEWHSPGRFLSSAVFREPRSRLDPQPQAGSQRPEGGRPCPCPARPPALAHGAAHS